MPVELQDSQHPHLSLFVDGRKFLWDGCVFESYDEASSQAEAYKKDNFEAHLLQQGDKHLVYTRRAVKEIVVTAPQ